MGGIEALAVHAAWPRRRYPRACAMTREAPPQYPARANTSEDDPWMIGIDPRTGARIVLAPKPR